MSKTLRSGNDAQHEAHKDLARSVMIRTFGLVELLTLELLNQADAPKKFDQNRQAPKGSHRTQRVADFDLPTPKKRLKFLPIVLFRRLKGMFLHNSFSHNRLEQNELDLPQAKFGFWVNTSHNFRLDQYLRSLA